MQFESNSSNAPCTTLNIILHAMSKTKTTYLILLFFSFNLYGCGSNDTLSRYKPYLYKDTHYLHLHGNVKSIRNGTLQDLSSYSPDKNYGTAVEEVFIYGNGGYFEYDRNGLEVRSVLIDSLTDVVEKSNDYILLYHIDSVDLMMKSKLFGKNQRLPFYVQNPYTIRVNFKMNRFNTFDIFSYQIGDNDKILQEKVLWPDDPDSIVASDQMTRVENIYNEKGQIVEQELYFKEFWNERDISGAFEEFHELYFIVSYSKLSKKYTYDEQGYLNTYSLYNFDELQYQETYHYNDEGQLKWLHRYVISERTRFKYFDTDHTDIYFNENEDIEKAVSYSNQTGEVIDTRYYQYEYDSNNNWTTTYIYRNEMSPEGLVFKSQRIITYYED